MLQLLLFFFSFLFHLLFIFFYFFLGEIYFLVIYLNIWLSIFWGDWFFLFWNRASLLLFLLWFFFFWFICRLDNVAWCLFDRILFFRLLIGLVTKNIFIVYIFVLLFTWFMRRLFFLGDLFLNLNYFYLGIDIFHFLNWFWLNFLIILSSLSLKFLIWWFNFLFNRCLNYLLIFLLLKSHYLILISKHVLLVFWFIFIFRRLFNLLFNFLFLFNNLFLLLYFINFLLFFLFFVHFAILKVNIYLFEFLILQHTQ